MRAVSADLVNEAVISHQQFSYGRVSVLGNEPASFGEPVKRTGGFDQLAYDGSSVELGIFGDVT
jgi:hypothetical protein